MPLVFEEHRLDDLAGGAGGPWAEERLRATAAAAAMLRSGRSAARESGLAALAEDGRPRSIVIVGAGTQALAGDALAAILGAGCPVPVITLRDDVRLPGWVAGHDLVIAVAATSGHDAALVARTAEEAVRRGCRLVVAAEPGGALASIAEQSRAPFVPLQVGASTAAGFGPAVWGPVAAVVTAAGHAGVTPVAEEVFEASAARLEQVAHRCRPSAESWDNPAKSLAVDLAGTLPLIWGATPVTALAARRFATGLAAVAGYPALHGAVPGVLAEQFPVVDGPFGGGGGAAPRSIFDDPVDDAGARPRVVLLRDPAETDDDTAAMTGAEEALRSHGVGVSTLSAEPGHPMERLAGLIALTDYATVYLAVAYGVDPTANSLVVP